MENDNRAFWKDKLVIIFFVVSGLILVGEWIIILFYIPHNIDIALHYSVYIGIDTVGYWYELLIVPIIGSIVLAINFVLAKMVIQVNHFASFIFTLSTIFVETFLFISLIMLYIVNQ